MVMMVEPVVKAIESVLEQVSGKNFKKTRILLAAADGKVYNQQLANELTQEDHLVILCGHYKGIDERISHWVDDKISVGDYVLSGGEVPAMVIVDSIARLLPGVVSDFESVRTDSHYEGLLGAPVYTRPREFRGLEVPEVLLSGHHRKIEEYRFLESYGRTERWRADMLERYVLSRDEKKILKKYAKAEKKEGTHEHNGTDQ
jgi:tRNA (guanine37-N1)-methyltransferase